MLHLTAIMTLKKQYPFYIKGKFKNSITEKNSKHFFSCLLYMYNSLKNIKSMCTMIKDQKKQSFKKPCIVPLGHASVLFCFEKRTIISDPIFNSPMFFIKRHIPFTPKIEDLPVIDDIILSHTHRDHCDISSLKKLYELNNNIVAHVPLGSGDLIKTSGIKNIHEYTWWQDIHLEDGTKMTFLPAVHWSQHGLFDRNKSLWGSWMLENLDKKIYFAGDTAYGGHFQSIREHFGSIDYALLPIGPLRPEKIMKKAHMDVEDSIKAHSDLGNPLFIPIHHSVFRLGLEKADEAFTILLESAKNQNIDSYITGKIVGEAILLYSDLHKVTKEKTVHDNV